ncbi:MAG TPA: nuclear transport factor 2 family protein [Jiangellaceae bacterium]
MTHPNEKLLTEYVNAAGSGDVATLNELFSGDVTWHVGGNHALSDDHRGKEKVFGLFGMLAERSGGTARLQPTDTIVDDWFAVALAEVVGTFDGESLDNARAAMVLRIEDGRFTEIWSHHHNPEEMDRLWS